MEQKPKRNKRRTPSQWQALFAEQSSSGLSVQAFCKVHGIGVSTFSRWKSRLVSEPHLVEQTKHFIELSPPSISTETSWDVELALGSDIVLRIARS